MILEVKNIVKKYNDLVALNNLSISIEKGQIFGLLGPNGSGKTTLMNCIMGLLNYDSGDIKIFKEKMASNNLELKRRIGYVPQEIAVFDELTVYDNIDFFCGLYIDDKNLRKQYVNEAIDFVGLREFKKFTPKKLSGGLLRRLNLACGIAHKPELIIFDEPTVAIDPQSRNFILEGIKSLNKNGSTIIYTTHYMEEVSILCHKIAIIDSGKVLITGTEDELKKSVNLENSLTIEDINLTDDEISSISSIKGIIAPVYKYRTLKIKIIDSITIAHILTYLENNKIFFSNISLKSPTLNDVFLCVTGKELRDN